MNARQRSDPAKPPTNALPSCRTNKIHVYCGHGSSMHIDEKLVLPPGRLEWRGAAVPAPADVEATLARRYGATWHVPAYMDK